MKFAIKRTLAIVMGLALLALAACTGNSKTDAIVEKVNELKRTVNYNVEDGVFSFTIPDGLPTGYSFIILVAGRVKMGDSGMSIHLFEDESANNSWVAGKTYSHKFEDDSLLSLSIYTAIQDDKTEELLPETESTTEITIDENGELSISVTYPLDEDELSSPPESPMPPLSLPQK